MIVDILLSYLPLIEFQKLFYYFVLLFFIVVIIGLINAGEDKCGVAVPVYLVQVQNARPFFILTQNLFHLIVFMIEGNSVKDGTAIAILVLYFKCQVSQIVLDARLILLIV